MQLLSPFKHLIMHTTKTKQIHFREVLELYPYNAVASQLPDLISLVIRYFKQGDIWHRRHSEHPLAKEDFEDFLSFIEGLREVAEKMAIIDDRCLAVHSGHLVVNIDPFFTYLRQNRLNDWLLSLEGVRSTMISYIHHDNMEDFRTAWDVLRSWHYTLVSIYENAMPAMREFTPIPEDDWLEGTPFQGM